MMLNHFRLINNSWDQATRLKSNRGAAMGQFSQRRGKKQ
jgi:hypothetical protein